MPWSDEELNEIAVHTAFFYNTHTEHGQFTVSRFDSQMDLVHCPCGAAMYQERDEIITNAART